MQLLRLILFAAFSVIALTKSARAIPEVLVQPIDRPEVFNCYGHPDEAMEVVPASNRRAETKKLICSARAPTIQSVTDKRGRRYILLDYARRQRAGVDDYLDILRLDKNELYPVFETRLSCATPSPVKRIRFSYVASQANSGGLELKLSEGPEQSTSSELSEEDPYCDQNRTFSIDNPVEFPSKQDNGLLHGDFTASAIAMDILYGTVQPQDGICEMPSDLMALRTEGKDTPARVWLFCSSYGRGEAEGHVDESGHRYVILSYGKGHGTGLARTPYLSVFRVERQGLNELLRITTAWSTGLTEKFDYRYEIDPGAPRGVRIKLIGTADNMSRCCIPSELTQTIWVDSAP